LLTINDIATVDPDQDRAVANGVEAIMSNWFINRKAGGFARGIVTVFVSQRQDYIIPGSYRFSYDRARTFYPDVADFTQNIIIPTSDLQTVVAIDGTITGYTFTQRVVAARTGEAFNVDPAQWIAGTDFSPFAISVTNDSKFGGGRDQETPSDLIDRSESAIAVRNLINPRSIDAILRERFLDIQRLFVAGMGDPEMLRDLKLEFASGIQVHVGGHFDAFLELPRIETTFEGQIGGRFTRPDGIANVFIDGTIADWTTEAIQLGDILRIADGLPDVPRDFVIRTILANELRVSELTPFSAATEVDGTFVDYFIYRPIFGPDIQILPSIGVNTTGQTTDIIQTANRILLPGEPHYHIIDVAVLDPDPGDPNIGADGQVHFPVRVNTTPVAVLEATNAQYQVINALPETAQSQIQFEELAVESTYQDKTLRVIYETLVGFEAIHDFSRDRFERILAANVLVRGYIPAYLSFNVQYKLKPIATDIVDEAALISALVSFVNEFNPNDVLDASDISTTTRNFDTNIGSVQPVTITYDLIVPDGRLLQYTTTDEVNLDTDKLDADFAGELDDPLSVGLSDRNIRYMTTSDLVTVELISG
jgi:hypothetical protein